MKYTLVLLLPIFCFALPPDVSKYVKGVLPLYQELHEDPELSYQEVRTSERVAKALKDAGMQVTTKIGGYGVVGVLKNGSGKTVLLRTDLDALPVEEKTGLKFASKKKMLGPDQVEVSVMHACGHDIHMANLVGTIKYLAEHPKEWQGTIVAIGQPAEERGGGAIKMLEDGLYKKFPKPDFALAFHVDSYLETGKIGYISGPAMATADSVDVYIKGKGGHGAMPSQAIDPVVIASQFVLDLQTLISREREPNDASVVTVGSFHCGTKHNIIPDECHLQLTVRSFTDEEREKLFEGIKRKAKAAAASFAAPEPKVDFSGDATPTLVNTPQLVEALLPDLKRTLGEASVVAGTKATVSEDFSRYATGGVPIAMFRLGSIAPKKFEKLKKKHALPSLHSGEYAPDAEETLKTGIVAFSTLVKTLLPINNRTP